MAPPSPLIATSGNKTNATASCSISAATGHLAYVSGIEFTFTGSTAATTVVATLSGLAGGVSLSYVINSPAGATVAGTPLIVEFNPPLQSSNTTITFSVPALGTGNLNAVANIHGYTI
jgi:hypothetical protein